MFPVKIIAILGIVALSSIGVTFAATTLLIQNTPPIPVPARAFLTSTCDTLTLEPSTTFTPENGVAVLDCGTGQPGFTVFNPPHSTFIATYTLPTVAQGTVGPLAVSTDQCVNAIILTSGQPILLAEGSYDYCLDYSGFPVSGGTIPGFTVDWV